MADLRFAARQVLQTIVCIVSAIGWLAFGIASLVWAAIRCFPILLPAGMRIGFKFQIGGLWLGVHWSKYKRRFCINLVPCMTVWIALPGGKAPGSVE